VRALQARGVGRRSAIVIVFGLLLVVLVGMLTLTVPALIAQVSSLIEQEPALRGHVVEYLARFRPTQFLAEIVRNLQYDALVKGSAADVLAMSARFIEILAYGAGAFFLALYMMFDADRLRGALFLATPRLHHIRLSRVLLNLETIVGGYIRGQLLTCMLMGAFMFRPADALRRAQCAGAFRVRRPGRCVSVRGHLPDHDSRAARDAAAGRLRDGGGAGADARL
jgi:predicted PurR-regulated permease PerM